MSDGRAASWASLPSVSDASAADDAQAVLAGKTTFIKHLLGREYPGIHIGPEPTTDRFVVVMGGMEERRTPGNTLIVQPDKPYQVSAAS